MGAVAVGCGGAWGNPLAVALGHLSRLVELSTNLPSGSSPEQLAASYQQHGWQVDAAALDVLAAVQAKADVDAVSAALRSGTVPGSMQPLCACKRPQNPLAGFHP
jgi:hypothetical protein